MQIDYVYIRPVEVFYFRALGPYKSSAAAAWNGMLAWLDGHGLRASIRRGYGIINDDPAKTPPHLRRYDACIETMVDVDVEPASGIGRRAVPGGAYVVHRHIGRHRTIGAGFSYIRRKWVPGHGLEIDARRPHLEVYLNDPATTPARQLMTDLCVPVFPATEFARTEPHEAA
jgi:AraC family transcriptional regulator